MTSKVSGSNELRRWYGRRGLATLDRDRLTDMTIAICTVWNHFLVNTES